MPPPSRESFIATYLERDIPSFGIRIPGTTFHRFWQMLAYLHGQLWNASRLAAGFGVSPLAPNVEVVPARELANVLSVI
jgi:hypothetical protein